MQDRKLVQAGDLLPKMTPQENDENPSGHSQKTSEEIASWLEMGKEAIARAGVPARFRRDDLEAPAFISEAVQNDVTGLMLHGAPGVGKSMAMGLLIRDWFRAWAASPQPDRQGVTVFDLWRWIDYTAFTMRVQDAFKNGDGEQTAYRILKKIAEIPKLIIDDLGVEKNTPYVVQATYFILDQREKWLLPTYITTNVPLEELDRQYGSRITDRISGTCLIRHMTGKSRRIHL